MEVDLLVDEEELGRSPESMRKSVHKKRGNLLYLASIEASACRLHSLAPPYPQLQPYRKN